MSGIVKYSVKTLIDLTNEEKDDEEWPVTQITPYKFISNINCIKELPHSIKPSPHLLGSDSIAFGSSASSVDS